jgi:thiol:disulfide interchange protein DsbD
MGAFRMTGWALATALLLGAAGLPAASSPASAPAGGPAGSAGAKERVVKGAVVGRPSPQRVVASSLTAPARPVRPGEAVTLSVLLDIQAGWHVNSSTPTLEYLIPTRLEFPDAGAVVIDRIAYPDGKMVALEFAKERLSVYEGTNAIRALIRPPADASQGAREVRARLTYQACSHKACLAPETVEFKVPLVIEGPPVEGAPAPAEAARPAEGAPDGAPGVAAAGGAGAGGGASGSGEETGGRAEADRVASLLREHGLLWAMAVVFVWGLALNLTPCVYPMIPVTIGFFANQAADGGWGRRVALPALYVLGIALTYSALGVAAGLSGGMFGSTLQNPFIVGALVLLFVAMALWMFGLYEIRPPSALMNLGGGRRGAAGALLMGMTMGVVAAPCIGPFVVALLAFVGATGDPVLGFWLFFVLAIGMGLPNLFLGVFSGALASLPRSGVWLIYAKKVMGVALLAVALYFMQPFLSDRTLGLLVLAFALGAGIYLGLLDRTRVTAGWFLPVKIATGVLVLSCGTWFALPLLGDRPRAEWAPHDDEALAAARAAGRPVIIDFTADWCPPCKELDRFTFTDPRVIEEAARFALFKVDVTSFESESVRVVRERHDVIGVPTIVFIDGEGRERADLRLYGFEGPEAFLARMRGVR